MSRYTLLQKEIDALKRENNRLAFALNETNAPERTTAGLIEKLQNYIEDDEWQIVRSRAAIKSYSDAIVMLRKTMIEKRRLKRLAK